MNYWTPKAIDIAFLPAADRPTMRLNDLTKSARNLTDGAFLVMLTDPNDYRVSCWHDGNLIGYVPDHRNYFRHWINSALYNSKVPKVGSHITVQRGELFVSLYVLENSSSLDTNLRYLQEYKGWSVLPPGWTPPPLPSQRKKRWITRLFT